MFKEFLKRWKYTLTSPDGDIRERVFCMIVSVGIVAALIAAVESIIVADEIIVSVSLILLLISAAVSIYLTVMHHRKKLAAVIMGFALCGICLPVVFLRNGGVDGGAPVWMTLNIVYTFLMFDGWMLYMGIALSILNDLIVYGIFYYHPEWVIGLSDRTSIVFDSLFSVVIVAIAVGMMIKFYLLAYNEQRKRVEKQKMDLEEASQAQSDFFASMSHELRTPLNSIIGLNEMILRESGEKGTVEYAHTVQDSSKMLLSLINDILDMSQLSMQKMEIVPNEYDVVPMITELSHMVNALIQNKNIELYLDVDENLPKRLIGDRKRIEQILVNILSNAAKYTDEGSITFGIHMEDAGDGEVKVRYSVQDTGIGIKKEDLENLYDAFKRIDLNNNEKVQGSGLGLSIVKRLLDLMGGNIQVDSIYTKGSIFTVEIKQKIANAEPIGDVLSIIENQHVQVGGYKPLFEAPTAKVLVVDDNVSNCMIVEKLLSATKVQIDVAYSGKDALKLTSSKRYNLILLDHLMPEMDGIETLLEIKRQENGLCRNTSTIALTANTISNADLFYQEKGFDGYLEKPIDGGVLEATILSFLDKSMVEILNTGDETEEYAQIKRYVGKRKKRLLITSDCMAEISPELLEKFNIRLMYLYIKTENGRFADTIEIDSDNLSQYLNEKESTAVVDSAEVSEVEEFFAQSLVEAEEIIHITMAKGCGKSYGIAKEAAKNFDHVHVVDSGQLSTGQSILVLFASQMAMSGASVDEIIRGIQKLKPRIKTQFILPSVNLFTKGGYMKGVIPKVAQILGCHPIVYLKNSKIHLGRILLGNYEKTRYSFLKKIARRHGRTGVGDIFISHVAINAKILEAMKNEIEKKKPDCDVYINKASFSAACSTGIGSLCVSYVKKFPSSKRSEFESLVSERNILEGHK